jgi:hypothetical protein
MVCKRFSMMMKKKCSVLLGAMFFGMTIPLEAQVLTNGVCPAGNSSSNGYAEQSWDGYTLHANRNWPYAQQSAEVDAFSLHPFSAPPYSPALLNATSLGAGAVGTFPLGEPIRGIGGGSYILRISLLNIYPSLFQRPFNETSFSAEGVLVPVEFGVRVPFVNATLGSLGYTLYGETSAGVLLGMVFPTGGPFFNYSLPNSRFSTGASAYAGIGNTLRIDRYVGLYLNGGIGYYDLFSSLFLPQTSYFTPSVSIGFYFNIGQSI